MSKRARETEQVGFPLIAKVMMVIQKAKAVSARVEILFYDDVVKLVDGFHWSREMVGKTLTDPALKVPVYPHGKDLTKDKFEVQDWLAVPKEAWILVPQGTVEGSVVLLPRFRANLNEAGDQKFYRCDDPRPLEVAKGRKIVLPTRYPARIVEKSATIVIPSNRNDPLWLFFGKDEAKVALANARASVRSTLQCGDLDSRDKRYKIKMAIPVTYTDVTTGSVYAIQTHVCLLHNIANIPQVKRANESYLVTATMSPVVFESWTTLVETLVRLPNVAGVTGTDDDDEHQMALTTLSPEEASRTFFIKLGTLALRETIADYLLPVSDKEALAIYETLPGESLAYPTEIKSEFSAILFCAIAQPGDKMDDSILKTVAGKLHVLPLPKDGNFAAVAALKQTKRREEDGIVTYDPFTKEEIEANFEVSYTLVAYSRRDDDAAMSVVRERWENCRKFYLSAPEQLAESNEQ